MTVDLFFRRHFWIVNLAFIFASAYLVARAGNSLIESAVLPIPKAAANGSVSRPATAEKSAQIEVERIAQITGLPLPRAEGDAPATSEPADDYSSPPVKTSLRLRLLGTLVARSPEWSMASILNTGSSRAVSYLVGDKIEGAEILEIEFRRVIIFNNHRREYISSEAGQDAVAYVAPEKNSLSSGIATKPSGLGAGIRAVSESEYEVPRSDLEQALTNLNQLMMQARIMPAVKDGQSFGFRLLAIHPNSFYTRIGMQNGDVIKRINGYDLNSAEKALELYAKLDKASRVDIQIERNGATLNKTYNIR